MVGSLKKKTAALKISCDQPWNFGENRRAQSVRLSAMTKPRTSTILFSFLLVVAAACAPRATEPAEAMIKSKAQKPELAQIDDVAGLPRVLILGDSISIGYTLPLRAALRGIANVHRPPEGCGHTAKALENLEKWLGDGRWDVIHFNFGLHDIKYTAAGKLAMPPEGKRSVEPEQYVKNLEAIVTRLEKTGAQLIWRPTTPVPVGAMGRIRGDAEKYNALAAGIMSRHGVAIDDLNPLIMAGKVGRTAPDNVHFGKKGSRLLACRIAATIKKILAR